MPLEVVRDVDDGSHLPRADHELGQIRPRARGVGDDPQRKHRCVGEALPDDEGDEEGSSDGEPGDGRARPPRMPFGLVEAEDEAEYPDAAQGQPEDVLGEGARTLSGPRSGKASPPEEEGDDRDEHVDVQRPAPVEQVGERAAQNEARRRADAARRAERGECASPLVAVGEGRVEQREQRGGQKRAEGALRRPSRGENREGRGDSGHETGDGEARQADVVCAPDAQDSGQPPAEEHEASEGEGVGGDHPRALGRRHLQALLHVRQGDGDDRHVQHDHELGGDGAGHHRSFPALVSLRGSLIRRGVRVVRGARPVGASRRGLHGRSPTGGGVLLVRCHMRS